MHCLERGMWKVAVPFAGLLFLLLLMVLIPLSASAHGVTSGLAIAGTVQATPTVDLTVTALAKEQLALQVKQLQNQTQNQNNWFANNSTALIAAAATVIVALFGIFQWALTVRQAKNKELKDREDERRKEVAAQGKELRDRQIERERREEEQRRWLEDRKAEREKQDREQQRWLKDQEAEREKLAEQRFQKVVEELSSDREETKIGATITLRTFLRSGYEQFYVQVFDLAVAHLRYSGDPNSPLPLTTLRQALITVFKEAFPLARSQIKGWSPSLDFSGIQSLDASFVGLNDGFLVKADLKHVWLVKAYLQNTILNEADLSEANLGGTNLEGASLFKTNFSKTNLGAAKLSKAWIDGANLRGARFHKADLSGASLRWADLSESNIEKASVLTDTDLHGVEGLSKDQLATCKAKGAIIDEASMSSASRSTAPQPVRSSINNTQTTSAVPAQANIPPVNTGGSSGASVQPSTEP